MNQKAVKPQRTFYYFAEEFCERRVELADGNIYSINKTDDRLLYVVDGRQYEIDENEFSALFDDSAEFPDIELLISNNIQSGKIHNKYNVGEIDGQPLIVSDDGARYPLVLENGQSFYIDENHVKRPMV